MSKPDRILAGAPCDACMARGGELNHLTMRFEICRVCGGKKWVETQVTLQELRRLLDEVGGR